LGVPASLPVPESESLPTEDVVMEDVITDEPVPDLVIPEAPPDSDYDLLEDNIDSDDEGSLEDSGGVEHAEEGDELGSEDSDEDDDDRNLPGEAVVEIMVDGQSIPAMLCSAPTSEGRQRNIPQDRREPLEKPGDLYTEVHPCAGVVREKRGDLFYDELRNLHTDGNGNMYYPFANEIDFELAAWLSDSGLSRSKIDAFLNLKYVRSSPSQPIKSHARRLKIVCHRSQVHQSCATESSFSQTRDHGGSSKP
jgi:hypothetical protein